MRFLIAVSDQVWGGKHTYMLALANALRGAGHWVGIAAEKGGLLLERAAREGFPTLPVENFTDFDLPTLDEMRRFIWTREVDVVMVTGRRDYLMVHRAKRNVARDIATIAVRTSGFPLGITDEYRHLLQSADKIVILCQQQISAQFSELVADGTVPKDRFVEFRTTVDGVRFAPRPPSRKIVAEYGLEGKVVIASVARLSWEKGHGTLLQAFARLAATRPELMLMLVGTGEERPQIEALAGELGIERRVIFTGHREDIVELLSVCRIHVLASICEETGAIALQEAMAMEIPVVASRRGIIPDYVRHDSTGLLFASGDADDLTGRLEALLNDPELASRLGRSGRQEILERFDERSQLSRFTAFIEEFLTERFTPERRKCLTG